MGKITERNFDETTAETWGSVTITPTDDVVVGTFATWTITFTVGAYAMDVGGGLKIGTRRQADFGHPQFTDPAADNYATVTCSRAGARFESFFDPRGHKRPFNAVAVIRLAAMPLYPGDTVTIVLGDTSGGSRGLKVQSFPESASDFAVFVDPLSSGEYKRVFCASPNFGIQPGPSEYLTLVAPSIVAAGEGFRVQLRGNDKFGNPTPVDAPGLELTADPPIAVDLKPGDGRATWIEGVTLFGEGVRRLELRRGNEVLAQSNPVLVNGKDGNMICWGDTQAQTASTVGIGTPDEYFAYARDLAAIDFTTHQGNDFILSDKDLDEVREAAIKHNEPGRFAAFFGWEWSGPTGTGGDRNVLFLDDDGPIHRSSHWQLADDEIAPGSNATECVHARDLQARMREYIAETGRKVIMVPHIGGRRSDFEAQDPELEPVFEICSNHGVFEWRLHEFLEAGVRVGVVAASDDHTCRPGLAYPSTPEMTVLGGLAAVYCTEHSRHGIYDGMMARHCYGTTGARMILEVSAQGANMGKVVRANGPVAISGKVHGTAPIEEIVLFNRSRELTRFRPNPAVRDDARIKIVWSGATHQDRGRFMTWDGGLKLSGGRITGARPLNIFTAKYGIDAWEDTSVAWRSVTSGQEEGVLLNIDAPDDAEIVFKAGPADIRFTVGEARAGDLRWDMPGGLEQYVTASTLHTEGGALDTTFTFIDEAPEGPEQAYWVRVVQTDFHRGWSSPIFVETA
ncbi:MAG: hypothetical protein CMM61_06195 [Rhodospirillaceae bacterium]|nr:hypothetical protein [Rhodospirillaceae bacterium]